MKYQNLFFVAGIALMSATTEPMTLGQMANRLRIPALWERISNITGEPIHAMSDPMFVEANEDIPDAYAQAYPVYTEQLSVTYTQPEQPEPDLQTSSAAIENSDQTSISALFSPIKSLKNSIAKLTADFKSSQIPKRLLLLVNSDKTTPMNALTQRMNNLQSRVEEYRTQLNELFPARGKNSEYNRMLHDLRVLENHTLPISNIVTVIRNLNTEAMDQSSLIYQSIDQLATIREVKSISLETKPSIEEIKQLLVNLKQFITIQDKLLTDAMENMSFDLIDKNTVATVLNTLTERIKQLRLMYAELLTETKKKIKGVTIKKLFLRDL